MLRNAKPKLFGCDVIGRKPYRRKKLGLES
jgi:hypothetical protein